MRPIANRASSLIRPRPKTLTRAQVQAKELQAVQAAQRAGTLDQYYWYIKMWVPPKYWTSAADNGDDRVACWPGDRFPVFPVSEDVEAEWIEVLVASFAQSNPGAQFYRSLASIELLNKRTPGRWYIWNELVVDRVCERCGQVYRISATQPVECGCEAHRSDADLCRVGLCRVTRAYVDGVTWERSERC